MKSILEGLFYNYVTEKKYSKSVSIADTEIEMNEKKFKKNLNKNKRSYY